MRVLYVGFFHGGPYHPFGDVGSEGEAFTSRADAGRKLRQRVTGSGICDVSYPTLSEDETVSTRSADSGKTLFAHVPEDAYIDLYSVVPSDRKGWGYIAPEPEVRITLGPRFGMLCEPF
ncbi:hypothetical protein KGD83_09110 [Nocardiopsis akebiae]|uniref:Uncharacterized protein n=1 Tax=Nocardiopsis akebiae TaxID=2831968 RepID=A0ABX8C8A5_9ACTN|nr:hypothetical protein [Nocardiopsis akebiae]QUX30641.1 hypothetical protein KGD83_09110 [Nocardiopsis akebiae]